MTQFPDAYKVRLLQHANDLLEVAQVLQIRQNLPLDQAISLVSTAHLDATIALIFNSITIRPGK